MTCALVSTLRNASDLTQLGSEDHAQKTGNRVPISVQLLVDQVSKVLDPSFQFFRNTTAWGCWDYRMSSEWVMPT